MVRRAITVAGVWLVVQACSSGGSGTVPNDAGGGGSNTGGAASGGAPSGGSTSGGASGFGGGGAGGTAGTASGGTAGTATGGSAGTAGTAGAAGAPPDGGTCPAGKLDCNGVSADGCETDPLTSVLNCGGCGQQCPEPPNTTRTCAAGTCGAVCKPGATDCDANIASNGCEVFLQNDPKNCGQCGFVCPSENGVAQCLTGKCAVELVKVGSSSIDDLHVTATHVYFRYGNKIGRVAKSGGSLETLFVSDNSGGGLGHVAFSTTHAFWLPLSNSGNVMSVPLTGGSATLLATISSTLTLPGLATDGVTLFWCEPGSGGGVRSLPVGGGTPATVSTDTNCSVRPVVDATHVYWASSVGVSGLAVKRAPKAGGAVETFGPLASAVSVRALAVAGSNAYAVSSPGTGGKISRFPLGGGAPSVLVATLGGYGLAADGTALFVRGEDANVTGKGILSAPATGSPVSLLAVASVGANWGDRDLAIDGTHVYWGNAGTVRKRLK